MTQEMPASSRLVADIDRRRNRRIASGLFFSYDRCSSGSVRMWHLWSFPYPVRLTFVCADPGCQCDDRVAVPPFKRYTLRLRLKRVPRDH